MWARLVPDADGPLMAVVVGRAAAQQYRRQQAGLKRLMAEHTQQAWLTLDPNHLGATLDTYKAAAANVVTVYGAAWAELAARYYEQRRAAAKAKSVFRIVLPDPYPPEQIDKTLRWATRNLWDNPQDLTARDDADSALETLARNQGRDTVTGSATRDRQAKGFAREAEDNACEWCLMLAGRGAVYASAESAGDGNAWHNNCECEVVPVFDGETYSGPDDSGD